MSQAELVITGLLVAVVGFSALARALSVPYPIVLVIGGAVLGFVPGLPEVRLNPAIVLVVFLPPLLYGSAIYANVNDFRADLRWLALNTVPLVLVTMAAVALVAHALIRGLPWAAAFVLGAIVSPTDPLAAGRWPLERSCAASAPHAASSAPSKAKACSTTPPRSSPTASLSPPLWPAASHSPTPA